MKPALLYIILILFLVPAEASLKINYLSVNRGLSQQDVETAIQDRYGFMWFGTYDGLNRYDGYSIETFRFDPNLPNTIADNRITALLEDSNGRIWIGTEGSGLLYFDPATDLFGKTDHPLLKPGKCGSIFDIKEISGYRLIIGSTHGLFLIPDFRPEEIEVLPLLPDLRVRNLTLDHDGMVWVGTQNGAYKVAVSEENTMTTVFRDHSDRFVYGIVRLAQGNYAIYGVGGIEFYSTSGGDYRLIRSGKRLFPDEIVLKILRHEKRWLIATRHNIYSWDGHDDLVPLFPRDEDFFKNNLLQTIVIDRGNNLWITSRNQGVAQVDLNSPKFREYALPSTDLFVKSMVIRKDGRKVVGVKDYGLLIETAAGSGKFDLLFNGSTVTGLMEDSRKTLWFFSEKMYMLSGKHDLVPLSSFPGYRIDMGGHMACCEDVRGDVWVSTPRGIGKVDMTSRVVSYIPFPKNTFTSSENLSLNIYYDAYNDAVFCCTKEEGLYRYDISADKIQQFSTNDGLSSNHVWCLNVESENTDWIGTDVGVNRFTKGKNGFSVSPVSSDARIRNAKVMAIARDKTGKLWLTTSQGLFGFNTRNRGILEYGFSDGLLSNTLSEVAFVDQDGLIWISSISGLNYFDPLKLKPNPYEPYVVLRDFKIFNESIRPGIPFNKHLILTKSLLETRSVTLRYDENNFQVEVAPIHYSNPLKNKIAYRLSGIDKDWIQTRNRMISYNSLPAGNYVLEIKGANNDGVWSEKTLMLDIRIKPAPWFSWWAYLIYIITVSLILLVIYRYYVGKRELKMQLEREQMDHDNERQLNEAKLKFHTNITHEIRTPLALIVAPLYELLQIKIKDPQAQKHIRTIAKNADVLTRLVNQFLDFRKAVTMNYPLQVAESDLRKTVENVVSLFVEQAGVKGINYQYICESDSFTAWYDEEKISKIAVNIISNAFKFTPQDGSIFVFLEQNEDNAQIIVEDTGCGIAGEEIPDIFNRYFQSNKNSKEGTGIGLSLARQLAEIHHGSISVKSEPGSGSTFTVNFPVMKDAYGANEIAKTDQIRPAYSISPLINETEPVKKNSGSSDDAPIVLIVEDNPEMAEYMIDSLKSNYRTYHTANGNQGLELALIHTPDIILSDIMIEGMDGIQLTQTLKNDIRTCHIPIILISARSSEEEIMEGLHTGAEDYLIKPFNPEVLKLKILNLIKLSRRTKDQEQPADQKSQLCEREQKFVDELKDIITKEMVNPDFNIEFVCKILGTNRMQLHRKMMTILGMTASDYIKQIRFEYARELLETTDMNISETMYEVGLSSLYNFTQTFQKLFDENPSDIIRNRKKNKIQS